MSTPQDSLLVAIAKIADPAARETVRRKVNKAAVMPKVTATKVLTDAAHAGTSDWFQSRLDAQSPKLKSGPRKGWPKDGLSAAHIALFDKMVADDKATRTARPKGTAPKAPRRSAAIAAWPADMERAFDSGRLVWENDLLTNA